MSWRKRILICIASILILGLLLPQNFVMPVEGATNSDFNKNTFWYYPWGKSGTHKGVDIFAPVGTNLKSSVHGLVIYCGELKHGGKVVLILGPKWRLHYHAHLDQIKTKSFDWVSKDELIGTVGDTGNAKGKAPHLHYSILSLIPYPWKIDKSVQGWKKMFYLNPIDYLNKTD
jgi:murein DD-endopeptidase MepM/ murein hydrolase activator NlpD